MRFILAVLALFAAAALHAASEIAVTFDDLPVVTAARDPLVRQQAVTRNLVAALRERRVPAIGFVNANKLEVDGAIDPARVALLESWLAAGLTLGNHSGSHPDLHRVGLAAFEEDVLRGEAPLTALLARHRQRLRYFRHPFLHTGTDAATRAGFEAFLAKRGIRVAPVTIDNSEWIFARAYDVASGDERKQQRLAGEYLQYMVAKVAYYDAQSERFFKRRIRQVLLVHANALNAAVFGQLLDRLRAQGHRFITLDRALEDPAYRSPDGYYGPSGISWIHRWAITRAVLPAQFAGEPVTPQWVLALAGVDAE